MKRRFMAGLVEDVRYTAADVTCSCHVCKDPLALRFFEDWLGDLICKNLW